VSTTRRVYAQRLSVLVTDARRICVAYQGQRRTWPIDTPSLFASPGEALWTAKKYLARRRAKDHRTPYRPAWAA